MEKINRIKTCSLAGLLIILLLNSSILYAEIQGNSAPSKKNIQLKSTWGIVTENQINIRQYPDTYSKILGKLNQGDVLIVTGRYKTWYRILYRSQTAWIYSMYLEGHNLPLISEINSRVKENLLRREVVIYAKQFIGTPYRYGGTNLRKGVDCSGFTQSVMKAFNIPLHRSSKDQIKDGKFVKKENLNLADLVFFDTSGRNNGKISHVGIYVGNNQFIHANTLSGVKIDDLSLPYYKKNYVKAISVVTIK